MLRRRLLIAATTLAVIANDLPLQMLSAADWPWRRSRATQMEELASRIDEVQEHLDEFGTIVPKSPDVWGQSRLMRHREDFERVMSAELGQFEFRLQGVEAIRDAALVANAMAVSAALDETAISDTSSTLAPDTAAILDPDNNLVPRSGFGPLATEAASRFLGGGKDGMKIGIEPTIELDQLRRYLDHLNELRRLNEGDDTADSPGYSLNLVRIPISVLPGQKTRIGYGAEVTVTMQPHLTEGTLPMAFRDFVINDIIDLIGLPATRMANANNGKFRKALAEALQDLKDNPGNETSVARTHSASSHVVPVNATALRSMKAPSFLQSFDNAARRYNLNEGQPIPPVEPMVPLPPSAEPPAPQLDVPSASSTPAADNALAGQIASIVGGHSSSRRAKLPIAASHLVAIFDWTLAQITVDSALHVGDITDSGTIHLLDVNAYLRDELTAAYDLMSQPNAECLWQSFCTPTLVTAIKELRGPASLHQDPLLAPPDSLVGLRDQYFRMLECQFPGMKFTTTGALTWMIIVESALLDAHLKEDMRQLAKIKNCPHVNGDMTYFYGPNPPLEACMAFNEYVKCRWPIHVFALDPTTQQQNIGSSFSRRRELQLVLALAAARRSISADCLSRFVRRLEYDLETIELNNTEVGFSHGDDTFGWRFYPRVQAPPVPGNLEAIASDLLIGDMDKDGLLRERRLEPGERECTAIVVMPSFVPYVLIDVQSSWFRLADHKPFHKALDRRMNLEESISLGREVVELRQQFDACYRDAHLYRDGDIHRLCRAVDQLERQLPLQTSHTQVPHENTLGGFEMFSTGITDLAPELDGFYGESGILIADAAASTPSTGSAAPASATPTPAGAATTAPPATTTPAPASASSPKPTSIFLVGHHFTALGEGTRVIAGGIDVTASRESLSREVMAITVPSNAIPIKAADGREYVDVHLATPYGVSSHLLIPAYRPGKTDDAVAKHEKERHLTTYKWDPAETTGCIDFDQGVVTNLNIYPPLTLSITANSPFEPAVVDLMAWVDVKRKGAEFLALNDAAGKKAKIRVDRLGFVDNKHQLDPMELGRQLKSVLNVGNHRSNDIEAIRIHAYLRGSESPTCTTTHSDAEPVIKVDNPLIIKIQPCTPCPTCQQATSGN